MANWSGNVSIKKFGGFVTKAYAVVTEEGIEIRGNEDPESPVKHKVAKAEIKSIQEAKVNSFQTVMYGYSGITLVYNDHGKDVKVSFFARSMLPGHPDLAQHQNLTIALRELVKDLNIKLDINEDPAPSKNLYPALVVTVIFGYFLGGVLGVLMMMIAFYLCSKVAELEMNVWAKRLIYAGIFGLFTIIYIVLIAILAVLVN